MSSAQEIRSNIAKCEEGIKIADARLKSNAEQIRVREEQRKAWRERRDRANQDWENGRAARQREQEGWDRRVQDTTNAKGGEERHWNNCASWDQVGGGRNHWCSNDFGAGWYHSHAGGQAGCPKGQGKGICKKDEGLRRREAEHEHGGRPRNWEEPRFTENDPGEVQLDTTPLTIGCCNNMTNVIGSQVSSSTIQQSNNCLSNLQDELRTKKAEEEALARIPPAAPPAPPAAPPASPASPAPAAGTTTSASTVAGTAVDAEPDNKNMIMLIVALLVCCCLSMIVAVLMMMIM
jgi:hypothetical protein